MMKIYHANELVYDAWKYFDTNHNNWSSPENGQKLCYQSADEINFLCTLVTEYMPNKILEVGVASGGSSAAILHTLDIIGHKCEVWSVDLLTSHWDQIHKIGYFASEQFHERKNWYLLLGKYLPERLEEIGPGIDFVFLDTLHFLPGELLDFLALYPYLAEDSAVVLHDTDMHNSFDFNIPDGFYYGYATKILLDAIACKKLLHEKENGQLANISGMAIKKPIDDSIDNIFSSLSLPWYYAPSEKELNLYGAFYEKFYSKNQLKLFKYALSVNQRRNLDSIWSKEPYKKCEDHIDSINRKFIQEKELLYTSQIATLNNQINYYKNVGDYLAPPHSLRRKAIKKIIRLLKYQPTSQK